MLPLGQGPAHFPRGPTGENQRPFLIVSFIFEIAFKNKHSRKNSWVFALVILIGVTKYVQVSAIKKSI